MDNLNWITFAFTEELIKIAKKKSDIVVLDADLSDDVNLKKFAKPFATDEIINQIIKLK